MPEGIALQGEFLPWVLSPLPQRNGIENIQYWSLIVVVIVVFFKSHLVPTVPP